MQSVSPQTEIKMDKVDPVISGAVTAIYWTTAFLWALAYYITIPLHYPVYYSFRFIVVILSPAWYVFKGIGSAIGIVAALVAKLKFLYIYLASAAFIGVAAGCLLYGTSTFVFILLGVEPARDRQAALEAEHRRQQRVLQKLQQQQRQLPGLFSRLLGFGSAHPATQAGRNPSYRPGRGAPLSSSSVAGSGGPSAIVGTFLARALNRLGYDPSSWPLSSSLSSSRRSALPWPGPPPSYHTMQALSPPTTTATNTTTGGRLVGSGDGVGGAHMYLRRKSSKLSLDDVDVDINDIDEEEEDDNNYGDNDYDGGNVRTRTDGIVDEQELSDLAANEQDEQSYRESAMKDWLSNSSSVVPSTISGGGGAVAAGPRVSSSKTKGKMKARQKVDTKHSSLKQQQQQQQQQQQPQPQQHEQNRDIDHTDPLQEHRDLLDTQWKRIRSLDRASKQQHTIGGGSPSTSANGGVGSGAGTAGSGSRRGMLLSQTIHEESSETESL